MLGTNGTSDKVGVVVLIKNSVLSRAIYVHSFDI